MKKKESNEQYEKVKIWHWKMTPPLHKSVDDQYTTGEEQRKSYKKNEEAEPKWKLLSVVDVIGGWK